jgi:hypothetical protein
VNTTARAVVGLDWARFSRLQTHRPVPEVHPRLRQGAQEQQYLEPIREILAR